MENSNLNDVSSLFIFSVHPHLFFLKLSGSDKNFLKKRNIYLVSDSLALKLKFFDPLLIYIYFTTYISSANLANI